MLHQEAADMREARDALARIRAEGGHAGIAYKNYMLPVRYAFVICLLGQKWFLQSGSASRQRLLLEGRNTSMLCVPEGVCCCFHMCSCPLMRATGLELPLDANIHHRRCASRCFPYP